jgi:hypothetical protein
MRVCLLCLVRLVSILTIVALVWFCLLPPPLDFLWALTAPGKRFWGGQDVLTVYATVTLATGVQLVTLYPDAPHPLPATNDHLLAYLVTDRRVYRRGASSSCILAQHIIRRCCTCVCFPAWWWDVTGGGVLSPSHFHREVAAVLPTRVLLPACPSRVAWVLPCQVRLWWCRAW